MGIQRFGHGPVHFVFEGLCLLDHRTTMSMVSEVRHESVFSSALGVSFRRVTYFDKVRQLVHQRKGFVAMAG